MDDIQARAIDTINHLDVIPDEWLPDPRDIMSGKVTELPNKEISICYALMGALGFEMKTRAGELNVPKTSDEALEIYFNELNTVIEFVVNNFPLEVVVMSIYDLFSIRALHSNLDKLPSLNKFVTENHDLVASFALKF